MKFSELVEICKMRESALEFEIKQASEPDYQEECKARDLPRIHVGAAEDTRDEIWSIRLEAEKMDPEIEIPKEWFSYERKVLALPT